MARYFDGSDDKIDFGNDVATAETTRIATISNIGTATISHPQPIRLANGDIMCLYGSRESGIDIYAKWSSDEGETWTSEANRVLVAEEVVDECGIIQDSAGDLYLFTTINPLGNNGIQWRKSTDNGATWGSTSDVDSLLNGSHPTAVICPSGTNEGDFIVACDSFFGTDEIVCFYSTDSAATWSSEVVIHSSGEALFDPNLCYLPDGTLMCVWYNESADFIQAAKSTDDGRTWGTPYTLLYTVFASATERPDPNLFVDPDTDEIMMCFSGGDVNARIAYACHLSSDATRVTHIGNVTNTAANDDHRVKMISGTSTDGRRLYFLTSKNGGSAFGIYCNREDVARQKLLCDINDMQYAWTAFAWFRIDTINAAESAYVFSKDGVDKVYFQFLDVTGRNAQTLGAYLARASQPISYTGSSDMWAYDTWTFGAVVFNPAGRSSTIGANFDQFIQ